MSDLILALKEEGIVVAALRDNSIAKMHTLSINEYGDLFEEWRKAILNIKQDYHPTTVSVILPVNYSSSRVVQIPYAKGKQLDKMAKNAAIENGEEELVDYGLISTDKKQGVCICCSGVKEEFLNKMIQLFNECDLTVDTFTVLMEGYLKQINRLDLHRNKTMIYFIFEDNIVTSLLYRDGVYHYSTRSRLFSERGTLDFRTEITRIVSGIQQFYSIEQGQHPISDLYYVGCLKDDFEVCEEDLANMNIQSHLIEMNSISNSDTLGEEFGCLGLLDKDKKKKINLYSIWKEKNQIQKTDLSKMKEFILAPAITLAICLVVIGIISTMNFMTSHHIKSMNKWINSDEIQTAYQEAHEKEVESEKLVKSLNQVSTMEQALATYPDLTLEMINKIVDTGGNNVTVSIRGLDVSTGLLTFNATSSEVIDIPGYVQKLQATKLFSTVNYTGYSYNNNQYVLSLSCVLNGNEGGDNK